MITLEALEQLVVFADCGTLSEAAEVLHISQPTITRAMQSLEESFGVTLFVRSKNKIALNETGRQAVEHARKLLSDRDQMLLSVRAFDKSLHTISVESCAPAPLWSLVPELTQKYPGMAVSAVLAEVSDIVDHVKDGAVSIGVVLQPTDEPGLQCEEYLTENLSVCLPADHPLLANGVPESLTLADLNGYNCLLRSELGFWDALCRREMPASRFLVQTDTFAFEELIRTSSLPFFITNLSANYKSVLNGRLPVPISDPEANVTYYLLSKA